MWVRDALADDPARGHDPEIRNPKHLTNIETILESLPRGSEVVRKFRAYYKLGRGKVSLRISPKVSPEIPDSRIRIPHPSPNPNPNPSLNDRTSLTRSSESSNGKPQA